jgi:hypothetical protein
MQEKEIQKRIERKRVNYTKELSGKTAIAR